MPILQIKDLNTKTHQEAIDTGEVTEGRKENQRNESPKMSIRWYKDGTKNVIDEQETGDSAQSKHVMPSRRRGGRSIKAAPQKTVSSEKIQRPKKRKFADFVPSGSGLGTNLSKDAGVESANCKVSTSRMF